MTVSTKKFYRLAVLLAVLLFAFSAITCRNQAEKESVKSQQPQIVKIGLIPEQNMFAQKRRYEPLAEYIFKKSGIKINLQILPSYGDIIDQFNTLGLDGAFFDSFTAAIAIKKLGPMIRDPNRLIITDLRVHNMGLFIMQFMMFDVNCFSKCTLKSSLFWSPVRLSD